MSPPFKTYFFLKYIFQKSHRILPRELTNATYQGFPPSYPKELIGKHLLATADYIVLGRCQSQGPTELRGGLENVAFIADDSVPSIKNSESYCKG